ncbi:hypothetical protein ACJRO7_030024 [Eucalyptus globulus]|uniref:Uncharacterized protein n=1 Tax=Eucalyptus globulus TaxID=34317 RepID=A0ABD3JCP7_EUCGL
MGNKSSNKYWEVEIPPEYGRREIQKFIHAKYQEKKWACRRDCRRWVNLCHMSNEPAQGESKACIPEKMINFSLVKEIRTSHVATRQRGYFQILLSISLKRFIC